MIRRARARANFERANRELERAKQTGKNISQATQNSQACNIPYVFNSNLEFLSLLFKNNFSECLRFLGKDNKRWKHGT